MRVAVLMTCFNRREMTLRALASLYGQQDLAGIDFTVFLLDDGSRDGTAQAVAESFPLVRILHGDGSHFWNGGMRIAFAEALGIGFGAYLLFNDDTLLVSDALHRLVACSDRMRADEGPAIVVGSIDDPETRAHTHGGLRKRTAGLRLDLIPQPPDAELPLRCDTMNGNFTLIPHEAARRLGNLDAAFRHQLGDFDYGLRATRAGIPIVIAPGYFGSCGHNPTAGTWRDGLTSLAARWRHLMSPKGAPPSEWMLYTRRHYGWRWIFYAFSPYVKTILAMRQPAKQSVNQGLEREKKLRG